jgi:hypothetical protein
VQHWLQVGVPHTANSLTDGMVIVKILLKHRLNCRVSKSVSLKSKLTCSQFFQKWTKKFCPRVLFTHRYTSYKRSNFANILFIFWKNWEQDNWLWNSLTFKLVYKMIAHSGNTFNLCISCCQFEVCKTTHLTPFSANCQN